MSSAFGKGTFAEYAAAQQDKLAAKPDPLTFAEASAVSGLTALAALDTRRVKAGEHVILGASGGVGTYAVQIAKALGATVTGVASTAKLDLVRAVGADHVLDYATTDFASGDLSYDLIIDTGGSSSPARLRGALTRRGTLVIVGGEGGRHRLTMAMSKEHHHGLDWLAAFIDAGELRPAVDRSYRLDEVADAMEHLVDGHARGKVVIDLMNTLR